MNIRLSFLLAICCVSYSQSYSSTPLQKPHSPNYWSRQTLADLNRAERILEQNYIYAVYPEPGWNQLFRRAEHEAQAEASRVRSFADYAYVLHHFVATFRDPHLSLSAELQPVRVQWPGFSLVYRGGRYLVAASEAGLVQPGAVVTSCDNHSMEALNARAARVDFGWDRSQAVKADLAGKLLVTDGNRFESKVHSCVIDNRSVTLAWRPIRQAELREIDAPFAGVHDRVIDAVPFATRGEWVRLSTFQPESVAEAAAFHKVIAQAADWREKEMLILDLRGNGGGSYQWFMAFLRALYGPQVTDFYARERLKIQAYFVPSAVTPDDDTAAAKDAFDTPHDPLIEQSEAEPRRVRLSHQHYAYQQRRIPAAQSGAPAGPPPENPVKARVFVLTDNHSGSAVNSFLDEALRIPGVELIGTAPLSDRRSGSPAPFTLPSGSFTLHVPAMIRIGRSRDEMQEYEPKFRFDGNITDTDAVKQWILSAVLNPSR